MPFEVTKIIAQKLAFLKHIPLLPIIFDEQLKVYTLFFNPIVFSKMMEFVKAIKALDHCQAKYHRYGGLEFRVQKKEFCHIHGDGLVDILLNKRIATQLIQAHQCEPHHIIKNTGWISFPIKKNTDMQKLIEITTNAYNLATSPRTG